MIRDNDVIADVLRILPRPEAFYHAAHQEIYRAIVDRANRGQPVDLVLLADDLKERNQVEQVGGYGNLGELWDAAPTAANGEHYARIVRERWLLRTLIHVHTEGARDAHDGSSPAEELLEASQAKLFELSQAGTHAGSALLDVHLRRAIAAIDARCQKNGADGAILTGLIDLDNQLGGLRPSELSIVASRPSGGKSSLALGIARHVTEDLGHAALFFSLEMSGCELAERLMIAKAGVNSRFVRAGTVPKDQLGKLADAAAELAPARLHIDDNPSQGMMQIASSARRHRAKHDVRIVIADYLQLIAPENRKAPRQEQVAAISRQLKQMARELKIPVLALAQLNRDADDREPRLGDLRESGAIEADADTVMLLHRDQDEDDCRDVKTVQVHVAKQRNGPTGKVQLLFNKRFMNFENLMLENRGCNP
jgi:replicative DNA helicase